MFIEEYNKLFDMDKERFSQSVNLLLLQNYVLRDVYNAREGNTKLSQEYRFIERNYQLIASYLEFGQWTLYKDDTYGVIYCRSKIECNKLRLNKLTTILIFLLRYLYDEGREKVSIRREVVVSVGEIMERLINFGITNKKIPDKDLIESLSLLRKYKIIDKIEGKYTQPDTNIIIYPSILFVVTNDRINSLKDLISDEDNDEFDDDCGEDE